jgi:hypothetical protein
MLFLAPVWGLHRVVLHVAQATSENKLEKGPFLMPLLATRYEDDAHSLIGPSRLRCSEVYITSIPKRVFVVAAIFHSTD